MRFIKIRFRNFLSYGNSWTEFQLDSNQTILLSGKNGVGKSGISDAIFYGYTGKSYRNVPKPKLINNKNGKNLEVELEIEHMNSIYIIKRGLQPNKFEIFKDGKLIDEDSNIRDYQKQLEILMGIDYKIFKQTIMMSSRFYTPFLDLRPSDKREFIENIFSLKLFSNINDFLKRKVQTTKQNLKGLEKDISHVGYNLQLLKDINDKQLKQNKFQKQGLIEGITELEKTIDDYNIIIDEKNVDIYKLNEQLEKLKLKLKHKDSIIKKIQLLEYKIVSFQDKINFLIENNDCKSCGQHIEEGFKEISIKEQEQYKEHHSKELIKINKSLDKINIINTKVDVLIRGINNLNQEVMVLHSKIDGDEYRIKEKKEFINNINEVSVVSTDDFVSLNTNLINLKKKRKNLEIFIKYIKITIQLISETGIKKYIISKYIPILNTLLNKYLEYNSAPYSVMFNELFEENIIARGYENLGYGNLSSGEKQRLDTALIFAFLDLCRLKNSVNSNLIIFDEVLDQSLDEAGIESIIGIFNKLKLKGYSVIVVSHREGMNENFDKCYSVTKNKFSQIEEV